MNTPAITTTTQTFLTNEEPMAQLMSAMLDLMNNSAFDILPEDSKLKVLEIIIKAKENKSQQDEAKWESQQAGLNQLRINSLLGSSCPSKVNKNKDQLSIVPTFDQEGWLKGHTL